MRIKPFGLTMMPIPKCIGPRVIISEFLPKADIFGDFLDEDGESSDWVELQNLSDGDVSLQVRP